MTSGIGSVPITNEFICGICSATFGRCKSLLKHMLIHSGLPGDYYIPGEDFDLKSRFEEYPLTYMSIPAVTPASGVKSSPELTGINYIPRMATKKSEGSVNNYVPMSPTNCMMNNQPPRLNDLAASRNIVNLHTHHQSCEAMCENSRTVESPTSREKLSNDNEKHKNTIFDVHGIDTSYRAFSRNCIVRSQEKFKMKKEFYVCDICDKVFTHLYSLKSHIELHAGESEHTCPTCSKRVSSARALIRHIATHEGQDIQDKPYACDICEGTFSTSSNRNRHRKLHTGEKPHVCGICGLAFADSGNLTRHMIIHTGLTPHVCDICGKKFQQSSDLTTHMNIHTGERPCKCDMCPNTYCRQSELNLHKKRHYGFRPYACDICQKSYTRPHELNTHRRNKHYLYGVSNL